MTTYQHPVPNLFAYTARLDCDSVHWIDTIEPWLRTHIGQYPHTWTVYKTYTGIIVMFKTADDHTLFTLRWVGE